MCYGGRSMHRDLDDQCVTMGNPCVVMDDLCVVFAFATDCMSLWGLRKVAAS